MFGKASLDSTRWQVRVADYHRPLEVKQIRPSEPTEECIFHNGKFSQDRQDRLATDSGGQQKEQRQIGGVLTAHVRVAQQVDAGVCQVVARQYLNLN